MKYIATISKEQWNLGGIKRILSRLDAKEVYIGEERGKSGYEHYQCAFDLAGDLSEYVSRNSVGWHVEPCISWGDAIEYCRKDGRYHYYGNSIEEVEYRRIRTFGLSAYQQDIMESVQAGNDRTVTCWIDRKGSKGKSTLLYLQARNRKWLPIPRTEQTAVRIIDFVAKFYDNHEAIVLDLPRKKTVTESLCEALEDIKDGLIASAKYEGKIRFIRGVKILVFTNNEIPKKTLEALSSDRWDIHIDE